MIPQFLVPGLWFYTENKKEPFYIGSINNQTAMMFRKTELNGVPMTDSTHCLFSYLKGIALDPEILESFGFTHCNRHDDDTYMVTEVYRPIITTNPETGIKDISKPGTYLYIDIDGGKRFTNYLKCGDNKIFLAEISFVHELQILLFSKTFVFPIINITKPKNS
jgi:hypothetical protein